MAVPAAAVAPPLSQEVWLTSIQELQKSIQDPLYRRDLPPSTIKTLLFSHFHQLKNPYQPFSVPSDASKNAVSSPSAEVIIPGSVQVTTLEGVKLKVGNEEKTLALDLSERLGIDEVESFVMVERFKRDEKNRREGNLADELAALSQSTLNPSSSINRKPIPSSSDLDITLNQLVLFAQEEHQALVKIITNIIFRMNNLHYSDPMEELEGLEDEQANEQMLSNAVKARKVDFLCRDFMAELKDSEQGYNIVKELFTGFAKAAHTPASLAFGKEMAKSQAIHWLRIQISFLEGLFQLAYYGTIFYEGETSIALIQGIIGSNLGMRQENQRILDGMAPMETPFLMGKIEALLGMICLEALGTSQFARGTIDPKALWEARDDPPHEGQGNPKSIHQSAEWIQTVFDTFNSASPECVARETFALILVGWAFVLITLPIECRPPIPPLGDPTEVEDEQQLKNRREKNSYRRVLAHALKEETGLFKGWKRILDGGLFWREGGKGLVEDEYMVHYKDTMSCLMVALVQTIRPMYITPYEELASVFQMIYGVGSASSVAEVCDEYWRNTHGSETPSDNRHEILEEAKFPLFPVALPELVRALNGRGDRSTGKDSEDTSAVKKAFEYLSVIEGITTMVVEQDGVTKRELLPKGVVVITLLKDLVLPSGQVIPDKTKGRFLGQTNGLTGTKTVVKWNVKLSGWEMLSSLMLAAIGDRDLAERWSEFINTSELTAVLSSVLGFVRDAVLVRPSLVKGLLHSEDLSASTNNAPSGPDLLSIACSLLQRESIARTDAKWQEAVGAAFGIATGLLSKYPRRIWSELRRASFFPSNSSTQHILQALVNQGNASGQYKLLLTALQLVEALVDDIELGQYQQDAQVLYVRANAMAATINFLHQSVWARHRGWRYADGRQKAQITSSLATIYTKILRNPTFTSQFADPSAQVPLHAVNTVLWDQLVITSSDVDLLPISDVIKGPIVGLAAASTAVARSPEYAAALSDIMELAYRLLLVEMTAGVDGSIGLLRLICSFTAASEDTAHIIEAVFKLVASPYTSDKTAIRGLQFLTLLMTYAAGVVQTPLSFVACLKSPKQTSEEFIALLSPGVRSAEAQDAAWTVLRTMLALQPALGRLCLFAGGVEGGQRSVGLQAALDIISTWNAAKDDPCMLARAIGLLKDIYQYQPDLIEKLNLGSTPDATQPDPESPAGKVWNGIIAAAADLHPALPRIEVSTDLTSGDGEKAVTGLVSGCYRREAKALAISLFAIVLDGFNGQVDEKTAAREDLSRALTLLHDPKPDAEVDEQQEGKKEKNEASRLLGPLMADSVGRSFDPGLHLDALETVRAILPISSFDGLGERAPLPLRRFGVEYSFDISSIRAIISVPNKHLAPFSKAFELVSLNETASECDRLVAEAANALADSIIKYVHIPGVSDTAAEAYAAMAAPASEETRTGGYVIGIQYRRYLMAQTLLEAAWAGPTNRNALWLEHAVKPMLATLSLPTCPLWLALQQKDVPPIHQPLLRIVLLLARSIRQARRKETAEETERTVERFGAAASMAVVRLLSDLIDAGRLDPNEALVLDFDAAVSAISAINGIELQESRLMSDLHEYGIIMRTCDLLSNAGPWQTRFLGSIAKLHWTISQTEVGAQRLSNQGVLRAYAGTTFVQDLSSKPSIVDEDAEAHQTWTSLLSVARSMLQTLPYTVEYVSAEIIPFVDTMHRRINSALDWALDDEGSLGRLGEIHAILEILLHIAQDVELDPDLSKELLRRYGQSVLGYLSVTTRALNMPQSIRLRVEIALDLDIAESATPDEQLQKAAKIAEDTVTQALLVTSFSAVSLLAEWIDIVDAFSKTPTAFFAAPTRLPNSLGSSSATSVILSYATCLTDLILATTADYDNPQFVLPDFVQSWPTVDGDRMKAIKQQALETALMVASVQAAGAYIADRMEVGGERERGIVPGERGALTKPESTAKKMNADRKQFRQNLREFPEIFSRLRTDETSAVCDACSRYLHDRVGNLSNI